MEQTNKLLTKEQYLAIKAAWGQRKNHDATDHIIYNILRSLPADRGFTPISDLNPNKIRSNEDDRGDLCQKEEGGIEYHVAIRQEEVELCRDPEDGRIWLIAEYDEDNRRKQAPTKAQDKLYSRRQVVKIR